MNKLNGEINNVPEINYYNKLRSFQESEDIPVDLYLENFNNCKEKYAIKRYILKLVSNYEKYKECLDGKNDDKCSMFSEYWIMA
ncbi:unspecified product [Plasmodium ovale wallikeri]|uniref:Unspecified product n=1 Tax=Plasmodium ovale wallikeri TaxID=864142 RepID=A0A1A8ZJC5_PLAOA|nr:unspecified product [Plasmodium ovale wallikeri]SBT44464.1 unspecified product [Plasmodium ovale wallikeri]